MPWKTPPHSDPEFDIETVGFDDPKTYALLNSGRTTGVFQLESSACRVSAARSASSIDEIVALIALYRPVDGMDSRYVRGKKDPSTIKFPTSCSRTCARNYGVMVYQNRSWKPPRSSPATTLGGADMLRRAMGKKDAGRHGKERAKFVSGARR